VGRRKLRLLRPVGFVAGRFEDGEQGPLGAILIDVLAECAQQVRVADRGQGE